METEQDVKKITDITFKSLKRNRFRVVIEGITKEGKKVKYSKRGVKGITKNPTSYVLEKFNTQRNAYYKSIGVDLSKIGTPFNDQHKQGRLSVPRRK